MQTPSGVRCPLRGSPGDSTRYDSHRRPDRAALHAGPSEPDRLVGGPLPTLSLDLARAFLDGEWTDEGLVARALEVLRPAEADDPPTPSRRALLALARRLLAAMPERAGLDLERVAAWLEGDRGFRRTCAAHRRRAGRRRVFLPPDEMGPRHLPGGPLPELPDLAALAGWLDLSPEQVLGHADLAARHEREPAFRDYRYLWQGARLIEAPKDRLRRGQRRLLRGLLERVPPHEAAHGFVPGRSPLTHATLHAGKRRVMRVDLRCFFGSVHAARVRGVFRALGYPPRVARLLAGLCTTTTPADVASGWPWRQPHLPQGAPSSPWLANLVAWRLDARLTGLARAFGAAYSRYADDLTFSGEDVGPRLLARVEEVVVDEGFVPNPLKTRITGRGASQRVTGLVVNQRPAVSRRERDALKAALHGCLVAGPSARARPDVPDLEAHLRGRVAHVCGVDPVHGERLREMLEAIDWSR